MSDQPNETPQGEAEPPHQLAEDGGGEATPSLIAQLGLVGSIRLLIGLLGLGGFVVGVIVAWHSSSATTLLIVSAILLVLAALGLDWSEIRGTGPGGWTFQLLRHFGDRIEQVAAGEDVPPAIREELESLREEVKALTPPERPRRPRRDAAPIDWRTLDDLLRTKATHSFRGTDAVQLQLRASSARDARYRSTVKTPTGHEFSAIAPRAFLPTTFPMSTYTLVYPDDFEGSEPLVPGRYQVEWRSAPLVDPHQQRTLAQSLADAARPPLATDAFTIPERDRDRGDVSPSGEATDTP